MKRLHFFPRSKCHIRSGCDNILREAGRCWRAEAERGRTHKEINRLQPQNMTLTLYLSQLRLTQWKQPEAASQMHTGTVEIIERGICIIFCWSCYGRPGKTSSFYRHGGVTLGSQLVLSDYDLVTLPASSLLFLKV